MKKNYVCLLILGILLILPFYVKAEDLAKLEIDYIGKNTIFYNASSSSSISLTLHTTDTLAEEQYNVLYKVGSESSYTTSTCYVSYSNVNKYYKCSIDLDKSKVTDSELVVFAKLQKDGKDVTTEATTSFLVYEDQTLMDNDSKVKVLVGSFPYHSKIKVSTDTVEEIKKQSHSSKILYYTIRVYGSDGNTLAKSLIDKYNLDGAYVDDIEIELPSDYVKTEKTYPFLFDNQHNFLSNSVDEYALNSISPDKNKIKFSTSIYGTNDYNSYDYLTDGYIVIAEAGAFNTPTGTGSSTSDTKDPSTNVVKNPNTADMNVVILTIIGVFSTLLLFICSKKIKRAK